MSVNPSAFTTRANGLANMIRSPVMISLPLLTDTVPPVSIESKTFEAIWDTGATNSVITAEVVEQLKLKPIGKVVVNHANGSSEQNVYFVNIALPSNVIVPNVRVTEGKLTGVQVLIGMDIINLGDFSITNVGGITVMSFRLPSCTEIDYVRDINKSMYSRPERRKMEREQKKNKS